MLFTTVVFACVFLPLVWLLFFGFAKFASPMAAATFLFLASLFFYGYWAPAYTILLVASILANYGFGRAIANALPAAADAPREKARGLLVAGVACNLGALSYFKYFNFFIDTLNAVAGTHLDFARVVLPIGISFFTFTQIAFLVDTYLKGVKEYRFAHYGLFVTYFPHLIAGPILHHSQMMPQFRDPSTYRPEMGNLVAGLCIFCIGLIKKVVLADGISPFADAVFAPSDAGRMPSATEAWLGVTAYTLQLYFDFSGYSDMAIGLSWMFNVRLPINFQSPYQARSISDFWRRWHISLSDFLRDYVYIALGGNRMGAWRRYLNLMATMLLGGLWHGASWTFVFWGGLHGLYLTANHMFRAACGEALRSRLDNSPLYSVFAWMLTLLCVMVAWIFFRAETFAGAWKILSAMAFPTGAPKSNVLLHNAGLSPIAGLAWCAVLYCIALFGRNSNAIGNRMLEACRNDPGLRAVLAGSGLATLCFLLLLNLFRGSVSAFIYFNF